MQAVAYRQAQRGTGAFAIPVPARRWLLAAYALLWLQVALGGWVSTNYAVLACSEFPACQGSWWPAMDFRQGFELWRELGRTGTGEIIHFAALTGDPLHPPSRGLRCVRGAGRAGLAPARRPAAPGPARAVALLALWQFATGLSNVVLGWPLLAAVAHTGGAAALVVTLTWALRESRAASAPVPQAAAGQEVSA
jgi:cytochrome c oxidase assembly protein subunit 15